MGNTKSLNWTDGASGSYTSVRKSDSPSPKSKNNAGVLILDDDPRSPTVSICRTPIEVQNDDRVDTLPVKRLYPSSFTYDVKETNAENCSPQEEGAEEDSAFLHSKNPSKRENQHKLKDAYQKTPLRETSAPSLLLRLKQTRKASNALRDQINDQASVSNRK